MGGLSLFHWVIVILVVMLLFGRGRISDLMGDFAKGINSFKKGLADDDAARPATPPVPQSQLTAAPPVMAPVRDEVPRA